MEALHEIEYTYVGRHWKSSTIKSPGMINIQRGIERFCALPVSDYHANICAWNCKNNYKEKKNDDWFYSDMKFVLALLLSLFISAHDHYYLYKVVAAFSACILYINLSQIGCFWSLLDYWFWHPHIVPLLHYLFRRCNGWYHCSSSIENWNKQILWHCPFKRVDQERG
jgi:hypothetical protein